MKRKYFWNKKWFWISLTSLATIGIATFTTITNAGKAITTKSFTKSQFADSATSAPDVKTLSGYGYHAPETVTYIPWADSSSKKIIDVFPTVVIANRVLAALQNAKPSTFPPTSSSLASEFSKSDLAAITSLDLSNLNLTNINEVFNPALVWTNLTQIDLSSNNFGDYVLKFEKTQMPKLYSITARSANLNEMVDVSSYVTDPFDQATSESETSTKAKAEYKKALTANVPRYFDLFQNNIPQIPKYYLKIALAYLNLGSNKLGSGTPADPQGVYAIPWYSMETSTASGQTIGIPDQEIRGPYGINLYNTGEKKTDGSYLYSDEQVGRWRAEPYPIKSLRFTQYKLAPSGSGVFDTGVVFPSSDDEKATGGTDPYFNFGSNQLVNIPIFKQANVAYQNISTIAPQNKNAVVFVGLDDYKKSKTYTSVTSGTKPEMVAPQPDMIYPIIATWSWFNQAQNDTYFDQAMQGLYNPRSFNGFNQFAITTDSRTSNSQWDNSVLTGGRAGQVSDGVATWNVPSTPSNWTELLATNFFGKQNGDLTFTNTSNNNYYKKWTSLRTFILTPKTFWKKSYNEKWSTAPSTVDANLYWDTDLGDGVRADSWKSPWSGAQTSDVLSPSGKKGKIWYYQNWAGHITRPRIDGPGSGSQFLGVGVGGGVVRDPYILGFSSPSYFSNINSNSDYGTPTATPTPYTQGLAVTAPGYAYDTTYQVVKELKSEFRDTSNFPTSLDSTGFNLAAKYKKANKPVFAQNITTTDIKNGEGIFWKSNSEFDKAYMKTLDPNQIKINQADLAAGKLTYSFRVYSPGYSNLGRLFKDNDGQTSSTNDNSPTLDFEVNASISGFAIPKFQMKGVTGSDFVNVPTSGSSIVNNVLTQQAPEDFLTTASSTPITGNKNDVTLKTNIAKEFQTSYLGNVTTNPEENQGTESPLDSKFVEIVNIDNSNGTISFKVNVPDYVFANGNRLDFPEAYKKLTFTWTGLPKASLTVQGKNLSGTTGVMFTDFNINAFPALKTKAASEVTASDIFNASGVITTNRADWTAIKADAANYNQYLELNPNDAAGTLVWTLKLPGDANGRSDGLLPLTLVMEWQGFQSQSTVISWKTNLGSFGLGKTPSQLLADIKVNPTKYFDITNGHKTGGSTTFSPSDFDFSNMDSSSVINKEQGTVEVKGINLKSYYQNGVWIDNSSTTPGTTPKYLAVPAQVLQAQKPYYVATFAEDGATGAHQKIWSSVEAFYQKNINDNSTETNAEFVKKLSTSELKQLIVNNNVSPLSNVLKVTTNPATTFQLPPGDLVYQNNDLKQSVIADPLKGTLTFQGLSVKNWLNDGSNIPVTAHNLAAKTYHFTKLSNTWKWTANLPVEVASLSPTAITNLLNGSDQTKISALLNHFNIGQKYYDNDGKLQNSYTINPQLVELNPYLGKLTFKANAIHVTKWVTNGEISSTPHAVSEAKTYDLGNKLETAYQGNANLTSGVAAFISDWVKVVKNDSYQNATPEQKVVYDHEFSQLKTPNYMNVDVDQGIALTQQYLKQNNLDQISNTDMATINTLKASDTSLSGVDFTNYFYVPEYLLFLASPTNNLNSSDRTFAVAEKLEANSFTNTVMQLNNIYVINYYKNGNKTIQKIPNLLFNNFLQAVSAVVFKSDVTDPSTNQLPVAWQTLSATQIKQRLDYLTANRSNQAVNDSVYYKQIQSEWISTFTAKNIPYDGVKDLTIAYPVGVVANDYQRTLVVNKLLFPYFSQRATVASPNVILINNQVVNKQVWQPKVGFNSAIRLVANLNDDNFAKIPSTLLANLGLSSGAQADQAGAWKKLVDQNIYQLSGNLAPINNELGATPSVLVGNISVDDQKGTITFSNVQGKNVWVDGKQVDQSFADLVLNLGLHSTKLVKNSSNIIEAWLNQTTNSVDSLATKLIAFNTQLENGSFSLAQFNAMLNNKAAFFEISTPANNPNTKVQVASGLKPSDAFHLNKQTGEITFSHLEIVKGYLNNEEVPLQKVTESLTFNLGWDYSTTFQQEFQSLLTQKRLFNANADQAATVLNENPEQLLQYLNVQELAGQLETPSVSVSANAVLGKLTFNVKFQNYYQNGVNVGTREFSYTFSEFQQTLPAILGGIGAGLAVIIIALVAWYIRNYIKKRDQLMIKTTNKKKHEESN